MFLGVTTIDNGGGYVYLNGTSMSSPPATDVAAVIVERHPKWAPGAVKAAGAASHGVATLPTRLGAGRPGR